MNDSGICTKTCQMIKPRNGSSLCSLSLMSQSPHKRRFNQDFFEGFCSLKNKTLLELPEWLLVFFFFFFCKYILQLSICSLLTCTCKQKLSPEDCVNFHVIDFRRR